MEPWISDIFKAMGGGAVTLVGVWAVFRVQNKAASTERQLGLTDRWEKWAATLERRVTTAEAKADRAEAVAAELRIDVERYRAESADTKAVLEESLAWIEWALDRLRSLGIEPRPLPRGIARLLRQRPPERGE